MQTASEQALARQVVESRQIGRDVDRAEMQVEAEQERGRQAYEQAQAQWRRGMISAGAEVAGAGISEYITGLKTAKATEQATNFAYQKAVASDDFTGSLEQFKQQAGELTGEQYGEVLGIEIPTMERPLTADEIKRAGYYPAPEGFQYIYNENTGDVQLMGKTPEKPEDPPRNTIKQLTSMHNQKAPPEKFIQFFKTTEMTDEELTAYRTMYDKSLSREQQKIASQRNLQNTYTDIELVSTNPSKTQKVAELINRLSEGEEVTGELSNALYDLIDSANLPTGVTLYVNDEKIDLEIGTITGNKRSQVYKGFMRDILKAINKGAEFLTPDDKFLEEYLEE
jgi:hypothetical protein